MIPDKTWTGRINKTWKNKNWKNKTWTAIQDNANYWNNCHNLNTGYRLDNSIVYHCGFPNSEHLTIGM